MNIVKNKQIKSALQNRWKELGLRPTHIVNDAADRYPEIKITNSRLSKWTKNSEDLSETQILWLCTRYCIPVNLSVGEITVTEDNVIKLVIPKYNELKALKDLKIIFPKKNGKK